MNAPHSRVYRSAVTDDGFHMIGAWYQSLSPEPDVADLLLKLIEISPEVLAPAYVYKVLIMHSECEPVVVESEEVNQPEDDVAKGAWEEAVRVVNHL